MIPSASVFIMTATVFLCLALPCGLWLFWRKKMNLDLTALVFGIAAFLIFTFLLQQALNMIALRPDADSNLPVFGTNPRFYVIYAVASGSIITETGRLTAFCILKKKNPAPSAGFALGIGNAGMEAFVFTGLTMIGYISVALRFNTGNAALIYGDEFMLTLIDALIHMRPSVFLIQCFNVIITIATGIALSVIINRSAAEKGKMWLFPAAIVLSAALRLPAAMSGAGLSGSIWLTNALMLIPAALIIVAAASVYRHSNSHRSRI